jgi:endonuclease/exonuclease/phosphatase (EEP) superfamily protein YafD
MTLRTTLSDTRWKCLLLLIVWLLLPLQGCIEVPDPYLVIGQRTQLETVEAVRPCDQDTFQFPTAVTVHKGRPLDAAGFSLVCWNMLKGRRNGWENDFQRLVREGDVVLLQEAHLTDQMLLELHRAQLNWSMATAFRFRGDEAGVLTAAKIDLQEFCMRRFQEPWLSTPKTSMLAWFPLTDGEQVVVANVHAIAFTFDAIDFQASWRALEVILQAYAGPLIVAGDFNTWNADREAIVVNTTRRMGLKPVAFPLDRRTRIFGHTIDHVYFRGLVPVAAVVYEVQTSDHNPMHVTFRRADNQGEKPKE